MLSKTIKQADEVLRLVACKDVTLTLIGESGVGKEIIARRAHQLSQRRLGPFIPINCAAIPESLFESELFGHERGAFTGATQLARGKIEAATGGTLFMDEVGELPLSQQAKLLRFLESRRFMRVGGSTKINADVRLIFATLRPLEQDVKAGAFRPDLYYRIQGITVRVPPLRERREDIAPLLSLFIGQLSAQHGVEPPRLTREVKTLLLGYDWPGNARELRNVAEALCLLRGGRVAKKANLPESIRAFAGGGRPEPASETVVVDPGAGLDAVTRQVVEAVLDRVGGNKLRAAAVLKISPRTIQRYVAKGRVTAPVV
jgi:transcriptional regulator with PAS, ATPase and Fis domain